MPRQVILAPGAVRAGTNISLPPGSSSIDEVIDCLLFRGSDGKVPATVIEAIATKVDKNTIRLDVDTATRDLFILRYAEVGERGPLP